MSLTVGILLFPDVEVLDFAGPYEVFSVASRVAIKVLGFDSPPFRVVTIAEGHEPLAARHGLRIAPDHGFMDAPATDILIVPGGIVTEPMSNLSTLAWLKRESARATLTASVCTGAFILGSIGILDGLKAITHWEDIDEMRRMFPKIAVVEGLPYVDEGAVVTSAGISAGISMSLHLVERMIGPQLAQLTARQMQYDWSPA
ncbi:DJ-1/PfpI family protein [Novosphingobium sp. RD2P27]|uniref:DJ-1/PfpI family protein n=1 Tax=Novosphingobium kalidii TaxID=3230299 RepID=A0ABV2D2M0_9SPHN